MPIFMTVSARGQGLDRESLSGESVAAQLRQISNDQKYNLQVGPVGLRVDANLTTQYNDNINFAKTNGTGDFIVTPSVGLHAHWNVTDLNTLDFNLGIGYQMYADHSQYNSILLSPDTEARFNFFIGEVALNVHEAFSYQEDPTPFGQLSNTVRLKRFTNDAGVGATWDMDPITVEVDYDHVNFWVDDPVYDYLTSQSDTVAPQFLYKINPSVSAGMSVSFSDTRYEQHIQNDYTTVSVGPTLQAKVSDNLSVNAQAGGYFAQYSNTGLIHDSEDVNSYYASLGITHRINAAIIESLTAGHEFLPGLSTDYTERYYGTYTATWQATKTLSAGLNLLYENLADSSGTLHETSDRFGFGFSVSDSLTEHMTLNFNYQYLVKDATPVIYGYEQDVASLGLGYHF
jgi:hypothetical protein